MYGMVQLSIESVNEYNSVEDLGGAGTFAPIDAVVFFFFLIQVVRKHWPINWLAHPAFGVGVPFPPLADPGSVHSNRSMVENYSKNSLLNLIWAYSEGCNLTYGITFSSKILQTNKSIMVSALYWSMVPTTNISGSATAPCEQN